MSFEGGRLMNRTRTRWFVPVFASMAVIVAQSVMSGLVAAPANAAPGASFSATDSSKVPASPVDVGNPLVQRGAATDSATAPGTLGPVLVVVPSAKLPAGAVSAFKIFNQTTAGSGTNLSAGNLFHGYVLR